MVVYLNKSFLAGQLLTEPNFLQKASKYGEEGDRIYVICEFDLRTGPDPRYGKKSSSVTKQRSDVRIEVRCRGTLAKTMAKLSLHAGDWVQIEGAMRERFYESRRGSSKVKVHYIEPDRLSILPPPVTGRFKTGEVRIPVAELYRLRALEKMSETWALEPDALAKLAEIEKELEEESS